jgi:hypothetical protein
VTAPTGSDAAAHQVDPQHGGPTAELVIPRACAGPPSIGHGGYVAGLFFQGGSEGLQVTLRRPAPLDRVLTITRTGPRSELRDGATVLADAEPAVLDLHVPKPPTIHAAKAAEAGSPSHYDGRGVHPTCFGCGLQRSDDQGLQISAGPVEVGGVAQVAAVWTPRAAHTDTTGAVRPHMVSAALDCPGAFAFIAQGERAGLLGRIVLAQYAPVQAEPHIVTGWRIGVDGRKMLAGTALFSTAGELLAAAKATWFPISR